MIQAVVSFPPRFFGGRRPPHIRWKATTRTINGGSGNRPVIRRGPGLAADWWGGRWKEDFDRAAEGGQNAHRMSVEWSRIQPTPDTWDEDALDRYRTILRGLRERGLTPMVTLHHFSDPLWFYEADGWEQEESAAQFEKFVRKTVEALKGILHAVVHDQRAKCLCAERICDRAHFPTKHRGTKVAMQVVANMMRGHAAAYRAIHRNYRKSLRGICLTSFSFPWSPIVCGRLWIS